MLWYWLLATTIDVLGLQNPFINGTKRLVRVAACHCTSSLVMQRSRTATVMITTESTIDSGGDVVTAYIHVLLLDE
jgi:hypothetical protein